MKTGPSSLNPNAASYVPICKRSTSDVNRELNSARELNSENEAVWFGHQPDNTLTQGQHLNISQSHVHSPNAMRAAEFAKWKDHRGGEFYASTSQYQNILPEKPNFDDFDMDLAYLQMTFPGISEESLSDVYLANICDLDAAVDMIHQLEIHPGDSPTKLPDTLDIGDVPEFGSSSEVESQRVKNVTADTEASTSR
ncbi:hypothetical protein BUALT_Bualt05G0018600 [Buddleja alternifolia]|uniref:CUE domain-containing protein n=1 Tax=Buddleja alternifolia TaxID=168488 RepID=A0AAV6XRZ7_9LAMI|nr:hypothetical protein BUALT_Bualt05G0018600 [Buddleja alternifolia]